MFKALIEKIPYPMAGLMLGIATLGNVWGSYNSLVRVICGSMAALLFVLILVKIILLPSSVMQAFSQLPIAAVMTAYPMGMMVLATYVKPLFSLGASLLWWIGLVLNTVMIVAYTQKHLLPFKLEKLYASHFIAYIGIVVSAVTGKIFNMTVVGTIAFYFGLIAYCLLLPLVTYRYMKLSDIKEPLKPIIGIYAAPANLLVAGYCVLGLQFPGFIIHGLYILGVLTTVFVWKQIYELKHLPFYPSISGFTFPLAIGALATKLYLSTVLKESILNNGLKTFGNIQLVVATVMIIVVLLKYGEHLLKKQQS